MITGQKRRVVTPSYAQTELIHVIRRCGLTSGLKLCLDAGDAASYGSGQSWLDTSGNGYDFFRGLDGSAAADDPTFNGTAGQRSTGEYWSFDGADFFRYDAVNEAWMNNIHKDNAKFTLFAWLYLSLGTAQAIAGTETGTVEVGFDWFVTGTSKLYFDITKGSGGTALETQTTLVLSGSIWSLCAVSLDESVGANGMIHYMNGLAELFSSTYTTPSAANATHTMEIGARGNGSIPISNTGRLGMFAAWEGVALTVPQLNALYMGTRGRFGV